MPTKRAPDLEERRQTVQDLAQAIVRANFALGAFMERVHGQGEYSSGRRALLLNLRDMKRATVPQLAAMRPVSRQYIQKLIDSLRADGLVRSQPNPAHRRSTYFSLTPAGERALESMLAKERPAIDHVARGLDLRLSRKHIRFLEALVMTVESANGRS